MVCGCDQHVSVLPSLLRSCECALHQIWEYLTSVNVENNQYITEGLFFSHMRCRDERQIHSARQTEFITSFCLMKPRKDLFKWCTSVAPVRPDPSVLFFFYCLIFYFSEQLWTCYCLSLWCVAAILCLIQALQGQEAQCVLYSQGNSQGTFSPCAQSVQ